MEVVLRPTNDQFLREVVFPSFELGVINAAPAIEHLLRHLNDEATRVLLEMVLEHSVEESFFGLSDLRWNEAIYRLMFYEWLPDSDGWTIATQYSGYAGPWEETFHLALMLEDPDYPYADDTSAELYRRSFWGQPKKRFSLSTLMCGVWDPVPLFPPDQVLTTEGNGLYNPKQGIARADWSWRPMLTVSSWASRLPGILNGLLEREVRRLKPVEVPEKHEILDFWLGRIKEPPVLPVSFSGLGPRAGEWIREIGALAHVLRTAADHHQGISAVISRRDLAMDSAEPR